MNQNARILEIIVQSQLLYQRNLERILHLISQRNTSTQIFDGLMTLINRELQRTPDSNDDDDDNNNHDNIDLSGNNTYGDLSGNNTYRDLSGNNTYGDLSGNNTHSNHDDIVRTVNEFIGNNSMSDQMEFMLRTVIPINRLTTNQINNATTTYNYSLSEPFTCPITLENLHSGDRVSRINRCGHVFSQTALRHWFRYNNTCPVCRTRVL
jgi:hypothetical protein